MPPEIKTPHAQGLARCIVDDKQLPSFRRKRLRAQRCERAREVMLPRIVSADDDRRSNHCRADETRPTRNFRSMAEGLISLVTCLRKENAIPTSMASRISNLPSAATHIDRIANTNMQGKGTFLSQTS